MKPRWDYVFMLTLLTAAAALSLSANRGRAVPPRQSFDDFPQRIGDWTGESLGRFPESVMEILNVNDYVNRKYSYRDGAVELYIGYYRQQRAGEGIHSPRNCLPGGGWEVLDSRQGLLEIPGAGKTIQVNHYVVQNEQSKQMVLYWYDAHGRSFSSEYEGKVLLVWDAIRTGRTDGALIRLMTPFTGPSAPAEARVDEFARTLYPLLKNYLPE